MSLPQRIDEPLRGLLSCSSEAEAIAGFLKLRDEYQGYLLADGELRRQYIMSEAGELRERLRSVRAAAYGDCLNQAALLSEQVLPLRQWPSVYAHFRGFQRTICEGYPSNCDQFDWKAHLDGLDAALDEDVRRALN